MITIQQCHRAARTMTDKELSPLLFIGGYAVAAFGIAVSGDSYYDQYTVLTQLGHIEPVVAAA